MAELGDTIINGNLQVTGGVSGMEYLAGGG